MGLSSRLKLTIIKSQVLQCSINQIYFKSDCQLHFNTYKINESSQEKLSTHIFLFGGINFLVYALLLYVEI